MKLIFYFIVTLGMAYFLLKKRHFDFFTIGFFSAVVYFLPGFYGYAYFNMSQNIKSYLVDETYLIMITLLIFIIIGGILFDLTFNNNGIYKVIPRISKMPEIATILAVMGFIASVYTIGLDTLTQIDKRAMLDKLNIWHTLMRTSAAIAVVLSFNSKKWRLFLISFSILLFNTYIGFRSTTAYTVIALFMIYFSDKGKQRLLINNFKAVLIGGIVVLFFFSYKTVYTLVKAGEYKEAFIKILSPKNLIDSISYSEPFITQAILNEVIVTNFKSGYNHIIEVMIDVIIPIGKSTLAGQYVGVTSFAELISSNVFDNRTNIASNIWAEFWSAGGWILLIISMFIFICILYFFSKILLKTRGEIQSGIAIIISIWAFYVHRNTFQYHLKLTNEFVIIFIICMIVSILLLKPTTIEKNYK